MVVTEDDTYEHVEDYILNNRAVTSENLYTLEPMYTFILTPSAINDIRSYNDYGDNMYGKYTGSNEKEDFGYTCHEGIGYACISDYLTYLIDNYGTDENGDKMGVCAQDDTRYAPTSAKNINAFYNCRFNTNFETTLPATPEYEY